jgi:hypothetical protein
MGKEETMKFAKVVYWVAAIWGVLVLTPLYFLFDVIGRQNPPAITHPGFYYGFVGVGLAWQIAFGIALVVLVIEGRTHGTDLVLAGIDMALGVSFLAAWWKTRGLESGLQSRWSE